MGNTIGGIITAVGVVCLVVAVWSLSTDRAAPGQTPKLYCVCTCDGESITLEIETCEGCDDGEIGDVQTDLDESL